MNHLSPVSDRVEQLGESQRLPAGRRVAEEVLGGEADLEALRKVCKDFESIFVYTLLKTMRKSLPKTEGSGVSSQIYTSISDLEVAQFVAHGRGMGLGDLLFEQLRGEVR